MSLSVFFTAGYPQLNDTLPLLSSLEKEGIERVEIGIPFSDPLADGPVIQESSMVALKNGMSLRILFEQLKERPRSSKTKIYLMGYLNPVLRFGMENFLNECSECGVRGVILPDLPPEIYAKMYAHMFEKYRLSCIFLISPQTSDQRIRLVDSLSTDFIYAVSVSATTGRKIDPANREEFMKRISSMGLKNEIVAGFGISDNAAYMSVMRFLDGAISGTAFIQYIKTHGTENISPFIRQFQNT
ncbi:MAG: tryptophan synthase subunit alpha [Bacteroidia bacterium]|nr:tryptophan synthase subunit alpha [Bacteroidia bacterium]